jgi:hypothetical protein
MRKDMLKGLFLGILLTLAVTLSLPLAAQSAGMEFNLFRLKNITGTISGWGEPFIASNGRSAPSSIVYNNETYLPLSILNDIWGDRIMWNGDSRTYTLADFESAHSELLDSTVRRDIHGNFWHYGVYLYRGAAYLLVEDVSRGYTRAYQLQNPAAYKLTDDGIWFAMGFGSEGDPYTTLYKIDFLSDADNQDGADFPLPYFNTGTAVSFGEISGDYLHFTVTHIQGESEYRIKTDGTAAAVPE